MFDSDGVWYFYRLLVAMMFNDISYLPVLMYRNSTWRICNSK